MSKPLKSLIITAMLVVGVSAGSAQSKTIIFGKAYPDGCRLVERTVNRVTNMDIVCPNGGIVQSIEEAKRRDPVSFGGHSSGAYVAPKAPLNYEGPEKCLAASERLNIELGKAMNWFREQLYSNTRHLTAEAATTVRNRLSSYGMRAMNYGESIYRHRRRQDGEDGNALCIAYLEKAQAEIKRVFALVKAEAAKGNADLVGTGLNRRVSRYNN